MDIKKHINDTITFYLNLANNGKIQNKQYIINITFDLILNKNAQNILFENNPRFFYAVKNKCKEFLNDSLALPWFKEKMKLYDNIISELELQLLNNT